ncbi:MAG: nucleotidyltransferase domain-containing protein [Thermoleophilaceae bacterium]
MRTKPPAFLPLFRSQLQAELLAALLLDGGEVGSVSDLASRTGATRSSVHRELHRLLDAGILEREGVGRTQVYRAADSPLRPPLTELLERTVGAEALLTRRLEELEGVETAALYGSWAAGRLGPGSDIDLLVVGSVEYEPLVAAIRDIERRAGRDINVKLFRPDEYRERLREGSGFLRTVLDRPVRELVGSLPRSGS